MYDMILDVLKPMTYRMRIVSIVLSKTIKYARNVTGEIMPQSTKCYTVSLLSYKNQNVVS